MKIEEVEVGGFYVGVRHFAKVLAVTPNAGSGICLVQVVGATFVTYNTSPEALTERVTENLDVLEEVCQIAKANAQGKPGTIVYWPGEGFNDSLPRPSLKEALKSEEQ